MATIAPTYSVPFDAVAEEYDRTFSLSNIGRAQRESVWKELARTFHAGDRVLDIGCGTGVDACYLADRGVTVVACDSSPSMLAVAACQVPSGDGSRVHLRLLPAEGLSELHDEQRFDGAFSNFGALNCVQDLRVVAGSLANLLKPGAPLVLCVMGRHCAWEMAWYLVQGNRRKAFRRISRKAITARLSAGAMVSVSYPSVKSLIRAFSPEFRLNYWKGVGVTVPPSYLEHLAKKYRRGLRWLIRADSLLESAPVFRGCADHVLLSFTRVMQTGGSR